MVYKEADGKESVYEGSWRNDKRDGRGLMKWSHGPVYEGGWRADLKHGKKADGLGGTYTWPSGYKYVGDWEDGKQSGQGECDYPNGSWYGGSWKDNKKHG